MERSKDPTQGEAPTNGVNPFDYKGNQPPSSTIDGTKAKANSTSPYESKGGKPSAYKTGGTK